MNQKTDYHLWVVGWNGLFELGEWDHPCGARDVIMFLEVFWAKIVPLTSESSISWSRITQLSSIFWSFLR